MRLMPVTAIMAYIVNLALLDRVISDAVCQRLADERRVAWNQALQPASCSSKFTKSKYINKCV